ncbi:fra a 1-associated protein [Euphorbia lathyris]|uniref:fra a 1-associated protein n=1 Tax=Euphorbia lathyris TaxID=212925 RepID=UPI00331386B9
MGWVWKDDFNSSLPSGDLSSSSGGKACSTRKVVKSQCRTEEVEPGKFIRKCEKTEEVLRECLGEHVEVLKSNKEYTEEDVTDLVGKGFYRSSELHESPFNFPGLRNDVEGIERHFLGGINRFFEAAEHMRNSLFDSLDELYKDSPSSSPSMKRAIPKKESFQEPSKPDSGNIDLYGLAKDV